MGRGPQAGRAPRARGAGTGRREERAGRTGRRGPKLARVGGKGERSGTWQGGARRDRRSKRARRPARGNRVQGEQREAATAGRSGRRREDEGAAWGGEGRGAGTAHRALGPASREVAGRSGGKRERGRERDTDAGGAADRRPSGRDHGWGRAVPRRRRGGTAGRGRGKGGEREPPHNPVPFTPTRLFPSPSPPGRPPARPRHTSVRRLLPQSLPLPSDGPAPHGWGKLASKRAGGRAEASARRPRFASLRAALLLLLRAR